VSDQSSPTDKSKAHLEAVYRDTHRQVYQEINREVYLESTKILLKLPIESAPMKSTGWSPKWTSHEESMPSTDDYWLPDIFYRACGSTARRLKRAQQIELGEYNHFRETYMLDIDE